MADDVNPIDALDQFGRRLLGQVRTHVLAIVQAYDPVAQTAICKFARRSQTSTGQVVDPMPTPPLPVLWPQFGGWEIVGELVPGDLVELRVFDRSIGEVLAKGGQTDPQNQRRFSLGDSFVSPLRAAGPSPIQPSEQALRIGRTDGTASITIDKVGGITVDGAVAIRLGEFAADYLIKGTSLAAALAPIIATLTAVPAAADPATVITLANANKAAILAALAQIQANLSTRTATV